MVVSAIHASARAWPCHGQPARLWTQRRLESRRARPQGTNSKWTPGARWQPVHASSGCANGLEAIVMSGLDPGPAVGQLVQAQKRASGRIAPPPCQRKRTRPIDTAHCAPRSARAPVAPRTPCLSTHRSRPSPSAKAADGESALEDRILGVKCRSGVFSGEHVALDPGGAVRGRARIRVHQGTTGASQRLAPDELNRLNSCTGSGRRIGVNWRPCGPRCAAGWCRTP